MWSGLKLFWYLYKSIDHMGPHTAKKRSVNILFVDRPQIDWTKGGNNGGNGVCDSLIQKMTSEIVSIGQKTILGTPIVAILLSK